MMGSCMRKLVRLLLGRFSFLRFRKLVKERNISWWLYIWIRKLMKENARSSHKNPQNSRYTTKT